MIRNEAKCEEAQSLLAILKNEYKLSQRDLAEYLGVNQRVVFLWNTGRFAPNDENFNKLRDIPVLLSGRNIRYPKQALDILMGRE